MAVSRIPRIILDGDEESASYMAREGIRQLGILKGLMNFGNLQQDIRKVEYIDGSKIVCRSCFGEDIVYIYARKEEEERISKRFYIYVTISNYVTIWDSQTGEVAKGICNNEGEIHDEDGNPLITFPCHKDELVKWLEGFPNKPTRQVLKDEPENNRDYLDDNEKDIGNENRVEYAHLYDPSYGLYYGVLDPPYFTYTERNESYNEKDPICCYETNCETDPLDYIFGTLVEKNSPAAHTIINSFPTDVADSFSCARDFENGKACYMKSYYAPYRRCRYCPYFILYETSVKHIQKYFKRTKHLYLSPYPSPTYLRPEGDGTFKEIEYSKEEESAEGKKDGSAYNEAIDIEQDNTEFSSAHYLNTWDWLLKKDLRQGDVISINTKLGSLLIDYIPYKEWMEGTERIYERMRQATDDAFPSTYLREGVCNSVSEWEMRANLWPDVEGLSPEHATEELQWCRSEARSAIDTRESESNRTGVSWCGSITPRDELNEDGEVINEAITRGWYRIILSFYMGGFHTGGHEAMQNWIHSPFYCPNEEMCEELVEQYGGAGAECTATSWSNKLIERFSSVQATIELEKPEDYPRKKSATIIKNDVEFLRYKRPKEYDGHEEEFTSLCAFPGRTQGYPEDNENDICYPFDGTYDIFTLGRAVEELINNHYEDGSNDQLLVYLHKRDT